MLGAKFTHDAHLCLIRDGKLEWHYEFEKLHNRPRYTAMESEEWMQEVQVLEKKLYDPDGIALDGWKGDGVLLVEGKEWEIAPYIGNEVLKTRTGYSSTHMFNHVYGTYAMSPFSDPVISLTWDGGQLPIWALVDPMKDPLIRKLHVGPKFYGFIYTMMGRFFGPFRDQESHPKGRYDFAGKLMSYMSLGENCEEAWHILDRYNRGDPNLNHDPSMLNVLESMFEELSRLRDSYADADILRSIHSYLIYALISEAPEWADRDMPFIFSGGSALNINWNSRLREEWPRMFVAPTPNDSGNGIGAAAFFDRLLCGRQTHNIEWSVYSGPRITKETKAQGIPWAFENLAAILTHNPHDPIVVLKGRAEIGPRALGHRSIIMNPCYKENKDILNSVKGREQWRPVAPMCLEERSLRYFGTGVPDPYMLFNHTALRPELMPAVVHNDGTSRLQTVSKADEPDLWGLLKRFEDLTGVPVLCNTSANLPGCGFLDNVDDALGLPGVKFVWCDGVLYGSS